MKDLSISLNQNVDSDQNQQQIKFCTFVTSHIANQIVMLWLMLSHKASCIHFSIHGHSEQVLDYSGFILWYQQAAQIQYL
jgi:hypothetical protein